MSAIQHIAISAKDTASLAEFYKDTFGMKEVFRHEAKTPGAQVGIYLTDGHINLALLPNSGQRPEGIYHFGFVVEDMAATAELAIANGAKPGSDDLPKDGRYAEGFILDPAGTRVDLTDRGWDIGEGRPS